MSRITLLGLPEDLARQLTWVLLQESHHVSRNLYVHDVEKARPSAVFISGDSPDFRKLIPLLREHRPDLPVFVVTRLSDTTQWLDALEAGATDYSGAPFERAHLRWILDSPRKQPISGVAS